MLIGGILVGIIYLVSILFGIVVQALLLQWAGRIVLRRRLAFRDACIVAVKIILIAGAANIVLQLLALALPESLALVMVIVQYIVGFVVSVVVINFSIHSRRDDSPIGYKRAFLMELTMLGLSILIAIPFVILIFMVAMGSAS